MKRLFIAFCLLFLVFLTEASAYTHSWTLIVSENRSTTGWYLFADIGLDGIQGIPQWAYGASGTLGAFTSMNPFLGWTPPHSPEYSSGNLSGLPSNYNGYSFAWTWTDRNGSYTQTAVAAGIRPVALTYNFHVVSGGEHPTIGWSNDDLNLSQYKIRVLNPSTNALLYEVSLDYALLGAHPVYTLSGFTFSPGVDYLLRIEARQILDLAIYSTPDVTVIPQVMNRSTLVVSYKNSVSKTKKASIGGILAILLDDTDNSGGGGILTNEEIGYLTPAERSEIYLLTGPALIVKGLENIKSRAVLKAKSYFKVAASKYESPNTNDAYTAWFFRALTRVSALAFDSAADGVEDGLQDIGDVLDRAGYTTDPAKRNPFNYAALTRPTTLAANSPRGAEMQDFAYKIVLPELKGALEDLGKVPQSFNARWVEPLDSTSVESDYGDVLAFRSALRASIADILIQYAHNLGADIDQEYNLYYGAGNTAEDFLTYNPNFGNLSALNYLQSSKTYLDAAATDTLSAINWIQAETDDQFDDYVSLKNATPEEINDAKTKITAFKQSLTGSATIDDRKTPGDTSDDTVINSSPAFTGLNLRSFLPHFTDNVPYGFLSDPTFGGVLIKFKGNAPAKLNENLNGNTTADIFDIIPEDVYAYYWGDGGIYIYWDKIKWGGLQVVTEYHVYWKTSPGVTKSSNKINTTQEWVIHNGVTSGTTYYYRVAAVTAAGEGPLSEEAAAYVW